MEEISKMAKAYYQASSDDNQKLARDFFGAMDHDGDGNIDQREFLEFMWDEGYDQIANPSFFNQLDLDKNGTLDFFEVMTVYYIVKSGRPFCGSCKKFITSIYLTCVECLEDPNRGSFYLCLDCYLMQKCYHVHGLCRFLDNYSLLEVMTQSKLNEQESSKPKSKPLETNSALGKLPMSDNKTWSQSGPSAPPVQNQTWIQNNYSFHYPSSRPAQHVAATNAIVPRRENWKVALGALNAVVQLGAIGSSLCSIL